MGQQGENDTKQMGKECGIWREGQVGNKQGMWCLQGEDWAVTMSPSCGLASTYGKCGFSSVQSLGGAPGSAKVSHTLKEPPLDLVTIYREEQSTGTGKQPQGLGHMVKDQTVSMRVDVENHLLGCSASSRNWDLRIGAPRRSMLF